MLVDRPGPASAQDGALHVDNFGLNEKIAEGRMQGVGGGGSKNDFGETGDIERPACPGGIGDADPAELNIILRRHGDFSVYVEPIVAAAKLGAAFGEDY